MAKKNRKSRATKRTATAILAVSVGLEACSGHAGKHVEPRQYQEPPTATYESAYSTATPPIFLNAELWEFMSASVPPHIEQRQNNPKPELTKAITFTATANNRVMLIFPPTQFE